MNTDKIMRKELLALLRGGNAHMTFDDAVSGFPMEDINRKVPHGNYTVWHLLDHMRMAQWDILEFVRDPRHVSPEFPGGYWPAPDQAGNAGGVGKERRGVPHRSGGNAADRRKPADRLAQPHPPRKRLRHIPGNTPRCGP